MKNKDKPNIVLIIPALNEELGLAAVLSGLPESLFSEIIVCDNGSTDRTSEVALSFGATTLFESRRGYGSACLCAIRYLKSKKSNEEPDLVVFLDADYSDNPSDIYHLLKPFENNEVKMVIGSRVLGNREKDALLVHQRFGNLLATFLIRMLYGAHFTDLGPFRAVRWQSLLDLDMQDVDFGWTVEMQVKAAKYKWKWEEVPVNYRKRIGESKISGTISGSFLAGNKIITTIFKLL